MMDEYDSFLICFHKQHIDVYHNGMPLGVIRDGKFEVYKFTMPNGTKHPITITPKLLERVEEVIQKMKL